jgi:hypothetical protein
VFHVSRTKILRYREHGDTDRPWSIVMVRCGVFGLCSYLTENTVCLRPKTNSGEKLPRMSVDIHVKSFCTIFGKSFKVRKIRPEEVTPACADKQSDQIDAFRSLLCERA